MTRRHASKASETNLGRVGRLLSALATGTALLALAGCGSTERERDTYSSTVLGPRGVPLQNWIIITRGPFLSPTYFHPEWRGAGLRVRAAKVVESCEQYLNSQGTPRAGESVAPPPPADYWLRPGDQIHPSQREFLIYPDRHIIVSHAPVVVVVVNEPMNSSVDDIFRQAGWLAQEGKDSGLDDQMVILLSCGFEFGTQFSTTSEPICWYMPDAGASDSIDLTDGSFDFPRARLRLERIDQSAWQVVWTGPPRP